jgi:hypothetical protein
MFCTAEERVKMTSSGSFFRGRFDEKIASKASVLEVGGTVVVTEIGRWMEKNEATWTSNEGKRKVSFGHFFTRKDIFVNLDAATHHGVGGAVSREHSEASKMPHAAG